MPKKFEFSSPHHFFLSSFSRVFLESAVGALEGPATERIFQADLGREPGSSVRTTTDSAKRWTLLGHYRQNLRNLGVERVSQSPEIRNEIRVGVEGEKEFA